MPLSAIVGTLGFIPSALGDHQWVLSRGMAWLNMLLEGSLTLVGTPEVTGREASEMAKEL